MTAHNRCLHCTHEWHDKPGTHTQCPKCGHLYVKWLDYDERWAPRK